MSALELFAIQNMKKAAVILAELFSQKSLTKKPIEINQSAFRKNY